MNHLKGYLCIKFCSLHSETDTHGNTKGDPDEKPMPLWQCLDSLTVSLFLCLTVIAAIEPFLTHRPTLSFCLEPCTAKP